MRTSVRTNALAACAALFVMTGTAWAQPASEFFLGYSYMRTDPGVVDVIGGVTAELDSANAHGTEISGTWFATRYAGVDFSFGRNSGSFSLDGLELPDVGIPITSGDATLWTFLVGPRFRMLNTPRHSFDVRALIGGSNLDVKVPVSVSSFKNEEWGLAATFGAAYTVVFSEWMSYRVVQPDFMITMAGPGTGVHFRLSTGIVFRTN